MPSRAALQWLSLVGVIWLQSFNGTNTNFSAYSSQLKLILSISQIQLNNIAFASDAGKLLGWLSGIAAVYLPLWIVLLIGSLLGLIGYGVQYLFLINRISNMSYGLIFFLTVVAGNGICWLNTVAYLVIIRNFPFNRLVAVGITTSYLGLSAKIYTNIVDVAYPSDSPSEKAKGYLFLNAIVPCVVSIVAAPLARYIEIGREQEKMRNGFITMFFITIATGIYAIIGSLGPASSWLPPVASVVGIMVLLLTPLLIPLRKKIKEVGLNREERVYVEESVTEERMESGVKAAPEEENRHEITMASSDSSRHDEMRSEAESRESEDTVVSVMDEVGATVMIRRVEFWLYFFVYLFGVTLGLVYVNNLGQIAESRSAAASSLVSLSSSFGFFGRLVPSLLDYFFSRSKYMISRTAFMAVLMAPTAASFFLLLYPTNLCLYTSTAIIGLCTGAITSLTALITTELFGSKNFGVNHNVVIANIPLGSFLFGYMAALTYRNKARADGNCMGMECYKNTFILWGSLCGFGTLLATILYFRTRKFYSQRL